MVYQAYLDDSYKKDGVFVLAGYISTVERWADFSKEWDALLALTKKGNSGKYRFKMTEMCHDMETVALFYKIIEKHVTMSLTCKFELSDLTSAMDRIWVPDSIINYGLFRHPFYLAFRGIMDAFHSERSSGKLTKYISKDERVEFYFDDQSEKSEILMAWDEYINSRPEEIQLSYGGMPRFEDDEEFLPLQAADFWAWSARNAYEEDTIDELATANNFGYWIGEERIPGMWLAFSEDQIASSLIKSLRPQLAWERPIYDAKYHPRPVAKADDQRTSLISRIRRLLRSN
jgi:hypothetical protein